jgi:uncharacterized protein
MFRRFGLILVVNHACNMRCTYCYTGEKFGRRMPVDMGRRAIDRALQSLDQGGTLELAFFGGEPLAEAELIEELIAYAATQTRQRSRQLSVTMTTNGTIHSPAAWRVMNDSRVALSISHDGLPEVHDRHRRTADGHGTSSIVVQTIRELAKAGRDFNVIMVVRPDNTAQLANGIAWLQSQGARHFIPSLDFWAQWNNDDLEAIAGAIQACQQVWLRLVPEGSISWIDEAVARRLRLPFSETARCGFGSGEIAVAPSGRLYPCERLVGADEPTNRFALAGHATDNGPFFPPQDQLQPPRSDCSVSCPCSNIVRTGSPITSDSLARQFERALSQCAAEIVSQLRPQTTANAEVMS